MPSYEDLLSDLETLETDLSKAQSSDDDLDADDLDVQLADLIALMEDDDEAELEAELIATLQQAVNLVWRLRGSEPGENNDVTARFRALEERATTLLGHIRAHLKET